MEHSINRITLKTRRPVEIIDITGRVREVLRGSGVRDGVLNVITQHTTAAVMISEKEEGLQKDMLEFLKQIAPPGADYTHNRTNVDGRENTHSHLLAMFMNPSLTIPVDGGELALGGWQSIFFVELDGPRDERTVVVQAVW